VSNRVISLYYIAYSRFVGNVPVLAGRPAVAGMARRSSNI
jgi:hypothetical protein